MRRKEPDRTKSQVLHIFYQHAKDLQTMLDDTYQSPLLFHDCLIKAVKSEPFYAPLRTVAIRTDPRTLHTCLRQCIWQRETASNAKSGSVP